MSASIPVSVIIATKNEESRLARCLAALGDFDQVIVVDSNSTDRTPAIAAEYGAELVPFVWNGHYPKKRQWCLDHLSLRHDWVFFVDADEILSGALVDEIRQCQFDRCGYFVTGVYLWRGRILRHGLQNNKLVLLNRHKFEFPVVTDLDIPGMGEMEGHYQPVLKGAYTDQRPGQLRMTLIHDAAQDEKTWIDRHLRYAAWERGMNRKNAWPVDPVLWRQRLKVVFRALPARDIIAFLHCYIGKGGFLDGAAGYDLACKRAQYYRMIGRAD